MDIIFVRDIRLETLIGAFEHERRQPRTLQVNIDIGRHGIRACKTDQLADTIDYAAVVGAVREVFASHRFHLLEPLADTLADLMLSKSSKRSGCRSRFPRSTLYPTPATSACASSVLGDAILPGGTQRTWRISN